MKAKKPSLAHRTSTIFLQIVIIIVGIIALALLLIEPHMEGRNDGATTSEIYFNDPFLAYAYIASSAFFLALYQGIKLLSLIGRGEVFSKAAVNALRRIKYCALILAGFIVGAEIFLIATKRNEDDIAGGVMLGLIIMFISIVVATAAAVFERTLQAAIDIKSENDLTV